MAITIFWILHYVVSTIVFFSIILEKGRPSRTFSWSFIIFLLPVIGVISYYLIGKNYRKEKIFRMKRVEDLDSLTQFITDHYNDVYLYSLPETNLIQQHAKLINLLMKTGKSFLATGNKITVLKDGEETFSSIFSAMRNAKEYIHIQFYIFIDGELTDTFTEIFREKIKEGVKIRFIYDDVGSWGLSKEKIREFKEMGVQAFPFMPVRFGAIANKINYRNHRKIVIVDGKTGFTGGLNVADRYVKGHPDIGKFRDTFIRLEGPAVYGLQLVFLTDWYFVSGQFLLKKEYFCLIDKKGDSAVQIVAGGPDSDYSIIRRGYVGLINLAKKYLYISNPYLIPGEEILLALKSSSLSGIDVKIIVPKKPDSRFVKWCMRSYFEELMEAGVEIYLYETGFLHNKVLIADGSLSSVGTANVDLRSLDTNFEVNAVIFDKETTKTLTDQFFEDIQNSSLLDFDEYKLRSFGDKLKEALARILSPLL